MQRNYFDPANVIHQQQQQEQQQQLLFAQQQQTTVAAAAVAAVNTIAVAPQAIQPHEMPVPSQEPWNINLMPWKLDASNGAVAADGVMKFSANRNNLEAEAMQRRLQLHHKRKSDIMPEHPPKQFISEEKFTAHFNGLHISSDYVQSNNNPMANFGDQIDPNSPTTSGVCFTNRTFEDYQVTARELEEKLLRANRITICDEVRRMHEEQKKISFLPEALMNRMEKPCKALVLWQPSPIDLLRQVNVPNSNDDESRRRLDVYQQQQEQQGNAMQTSERASSQNAAVGNVQQILEDYDEFSDNDDDQRDVEIDDYIDNNNTSSLDFNNLKADGMDEDL